MEMVDVVIRLPLSTYNMCKANKRVSFADVGIIGKAIIDNGIALPKEHGRLIDEDRVDIELYVYTRREDGNYFALSECVKKVPTVIEANKEMDEYGM